MAMHGFLAKSEEHPTICMSCGRHAIDHTDKAECDNCGAIGRHDMLLGKILCESCFKQAKAERDKIRGMENVRLRGNVSGETIETKTEYFNAEILSLAELRAGSETEFQYAKKVEDRYKQLKQVLTAIKEAESKAISEIRAIQVTFNQLHDKLTADERKELSLKDINYKPQPVKVSAPKITAKKKATTAECVEAANKFGVPLIVVRQIANVRNVSAEDAAKMYLNQGK